MTKAKPAVMPAVEPNVKSVAKPTAKPKVQPASVKVPEEHFERNDSARAMVSAETPVSEAHVAFVADAHHQGTSRLSKFVICFWLFEGGVVDLQTSSRACCSSWVA